MINLIIEFVDINSNQINDENKSNNYFQIEFTIFGSDQSIECKNIIISIIVEIFCFFCSNISFLIVEIQNFKYLNESYEMLSNYMFPVLLANNLSSVLVKVVVDSLSSGSNNNNLSEKKLADIQSIVITRIFSITIV